MSISVISNQNRAIRQIYNLFSEFCHVTCALFYGNSEFYYELMQRIRLIAKKQRFQSQGRKLCDYPTTNIERK